MTRRPPLKQAKPTRRRTPRILEPKSTWRERRIDYLRAKGYTMAEAIADCDRQTNGVER